MIHKAWNNIEEVPYCFSSSSVKFKRSHGSKNRQIWPRLGVSGLYLQFEFTNGYEMIHKAWSSIEEVPYCFPRSSVKFQGHTALKIVKFDPNWAFPDCNSSLNSPMCTKWCTNLEIALKRCPIVFQGHLLSLKVTWLKNSSIVQLWGTQYLFRLTILIQADISPHYYYRQWFVNLGWAWVDVICPCPCRLSVLKTMLNPITSRFCV